MSTICKHILLELIAVLARACAAELRFSKEDIDGNGFTQVFGLEVNAERCMIGTFLNS